MHRDIWVKLGTGVLYVVIAVGLSFFLFNKFIYKPIVVIDLNELIAYQRYQTKGMKEEDALKETTNFFREVSKNIQGRDEIILVKQAVLNPEKLKDITQEFIGNATPVKKE